MTAKTHMAKAVSGEVVTIAGSNEQENVRPSEYIVFDDDATADIAVKSNQDLTKPIKRHDMFLIAMNMGLTQLGLNPASYNFTRTMRADIRNVGIDAKQHAEYTALTTAPVKTDITQEVTAANSYIAELKTAIAGATVKPTNEVIIAQIKQLVPTPLQAEVIRAVTTAPAPKTFSF